MDEPTLDKFPKKVLANIGVERAFIASRLIVAAERLQVFRLLQRKRMKADAIGRAQRQRSNLNRQRQKTHLKTTHHTDAYASGTFE